MRIKIAYSILLVLIFGLLPAFTLPAVGAIADAVLINEVPADPTGTEDTDSDDKYNQVVSWIKYVYHALVAKDQYDSTGLVLLSFGLIGVLGIRRKIKKH